MLAKMPIIDEGITNNVTNKSAKAMFTINAFPNDDGKRKEREKPTLFNEFRKISNQFIRSQQCQIFGHLMCVCVCVCLLMKLCRLIKVLLIFCGLSVTLCVVVEESVIIQS